MKIIVDNMPSNKDECLFHQVFPDTRVGGCTLSPNREKCNIVEKGFTCKYLQKFKG